MKPNVYQRIMHAAEHGSGLRLSADEVFLLSLDDAIKEAATQGREEEWSAQQEQSK